MDHTGVERQLDRAPQAASRRASRATRLECEAGMSFSRCRTSKCAMYEAERVLTFGEVQGG